MQCLVVWLSCYLGCGQSNSKLIWVSIAVSDFRRNFISRMTHLCFWVSKTYFIYPNIFTQLFSTFLLLQMSVLYFFWNCIIHFFLFVSIIRKIRCCRLLYTRAETFLFNVVTKQQICIQPKFPFVFSFTPNLVQRDIDIYLLLPKSN